MSDAIEPIKLTSGRASRGRHHVALMRGESVLLAGEVNPHKPKEVEDFIALACAMFPAMVPDKLRAELLQLAAPKPAAESTAEAAPTASVPDYAELDGGIIWRRRTRDGAIANVPLTNFTARILADVERDDGAETDRAFQIEARRGEWVRTFTIPAARFDAMTWPAEQLGACAIVYPGNAVRDHARVAIRLLSPQPIPRRTIFTHTGWRRLDSGAWAFLHGAGAIGATGRVGGIDVDLPAALALFKLPDPPTGEELRCALAAVLDLLTLAPDPIILPALCLPWRAVLGRSDFSAHFSGPSGVL